MLIKSVRVLANRAASDGGGLNLSSTTSIIVQGSLLQHNVGLDDGGGLRIALSLATSVATVTGSKILDNYAVGDDGGGIWLSGNAAAVLTIKSSLISGNVATNEGGGVRTIGPVVNVIASIIAGNAAPIGANLFP